MTKRRGTGLLMQWADVDASREDAFTRWLDDEHAPNLRRVPGILSIGRYSATKGGPRHLLMSELDDHDVLQSKALREALEAWTTAAGERQTSASSAGRSWLQNGYRQIYPTQTDLGDDIEMPPFLMIGRMSCPAAVEEEFNTWYNTSYIPTFLTVPGCLHARRFTAVDGHPKYMTVYEFAHAGVQQCDEWTRARTENPWNARMQPFMQLDEGSPAQYRKVHSA